MKYYPYGHFLLISSSFTLANLAQSTLAVKAAKLFTRLEIFNYKSFYFLSLNYKKYEEKNMKINKMKTID